MIGEINKEYFNELRNIGLFFCKPRGADDGKCYWFSIKHAIEVPPKEEKNLCENNDYMLMVVDKVEDETENEDLDKVSFSFHIAKLDSEKDWWLIVNSFYLRLKNGKEDGYPFIYLLWFLNYVDMSEASDYKSLRCLKNAIGQYGDADRLYLCKEIGKISRCLPYYKQKLIKEVLAEFKFDYNVYFPPKISEALRLIVDKKDVTWRNKNLFDWIDFIVEDRNTLYENGNETKIDLERDTSNVYICFCQWLENEKPFVDYQSLKDFYSLLSEEFQLKLIKRYFHDIRIGNTKFDVNLVQQFRDNKFDVFNRYRYCLETPEEKVNVGNKLLCDCVLTLNDTGGKSFQEFNGVLDFLISHCDMTNPNVNLGLDKFLVRCNGGAVYNSSFKGFIDYSLVVSFDESKLTKENIEETIRDFLDLKGRKKEYYVCKYDKLERPLSPDSICLKYKNKVHCIDSKVYEDKWQIHSSNAKWLDLFWTYNVYKSYDNGKEVEVDWEDVSIDKMKKSIKGIARQYGLSSNKECVIPSEKMNSIDVRFLLEYSKKEKMRIFPQEKAYISYEFDVFDIKKDLPNTSDDKQKRENFQQEEANIVKERVVNSLKKDLKQENYNGCFFELPYDETKLQELLSNYYFKEREKDNFEEREKGNLNDRECHFLSRKDSDKCYMFCSPKFEQTYNRVIELPYFWCLGKECFKNALSEQTLQETLDYNKYTLFHFAEILGYSKIRETEAGYEADETFRRFIAIVNKVNKKFKQLKCRSCGHIMFPVKDGNFNRYNYYCCSNPRCDEFNEQVYLNYCYQCKKGLIDSRDSKRCPNGWYICPDCLSCCSGQQYQRLAQRYVLSGKSVPVRIQRGIGYGHNNNGLYYCPKCGWQLRMEFDNQGNWVKGKCPNCGGVYRKPQQ